MRIDHRYSFLSTVAPPSLCDLLEEDELSTADLPADKDDFLKFGREWPKISAELDSEELLELVSVRKAEILEQKTLLSPVVSAESTSFQSEVHRLLEIGSLNASKLGGGGVYFLCDETGNPQFVVKPADEALLCLNNPKHRGSPFNDENHRLRDYLPLYQAPSTEAAVFALASLWELARCVPETHLMILSSSEFYDLQDVASVKEKLCSVQRFIPDSIDLNQAMHEWFEAGLENTQCIPLDQEDFEEVLLLIWLIFDGDGHSSNFRIYLKGLGENCDARYGIKKIDSGLSLPENNCYLLNYLGYLPNAHSPPSEQTLNRIMQIDEERCTQILKHYHLSYAEKALLERIEVLKTIAQRPAITLEEMNLRFELLCLPNGKEYALSEKSIEEITNELFGPHSTQKPFPTHSPLKV
jgi:hypothetical protein